MSAELRERICNLVRAGVSDQAAADACGLSQATLAEWLADSEFAAAMDAARADAVADAQIRANRTSPATWLRDRRRDEPALTGGITPPSMPIPRRIPPGLLRLRRDEWIARESTRIAKRYPWIKDFPHAIRAYAQFERLSLEAFQILSDEGFLRPDGSPNPLIDRLVALRRTQINLAAQMGLTPRGRRDLGLRPADIAIDAACERIESIRAERDRQESAESKEIENDDAES